MYATCLSGVLTTMTAVTILVQAITSCTSFMLLQRKAVLSHIDTSSFAGDSHNMQGAVWGARLPQLQSFWSHPGLLTCWHDC